MMRWGFIPAWAEGKIHGAPALRFKAGRLERSNKCREPWLAGQRCILPAAGFYTWQVTEAGHRQPFYVTLLDRSVFGLAAVWDRSVSEEDDVIESCAIVCVPANELLQGISSPPGWMPAILSRKNYGTWLRGTPADAKSVLATYSASRMHAGAVSPRVNSPQAEGPELIRPL
jgi:putative SOS response-associated peptidase YedK